MKARGILTHFISRADWVDPSRTVDKIILGDSNKEISTVLVTWISSLHAVRVALEGRFDMVITHEPTFWDHRNEKDKMEQSEIALAKKEFIEESGIVILRIHDVWDRMPEVGIPWAWAGFLGLGTAPAVVGGDGYQHRYDIAPFSVDALAQRVAEKTAKIGEPFVQVVGEGSRKVSRVGIGTGCGCNIPIFQKMGCDVSIVCDDGSCYWSSVQCAKDSEHPVIRVNHGTSEEPGMVTLTKYVNDKFPGVKAEHLPHGCSFRLVGSG